MIARSVSARRDHCRHERGYGLKHTCELGIDIRSLVGGENFGWLKRHPCYAANEDNPGFVPCRPRFEPIADPVLAAASPGRFARSGVRLRIQPNWCRPGRGPGQS